MKNFIFIGILFSSLLWTNYAGPTSYRRQNEENQELSRALTYTNPLVPLEFWEKAKRKPKKRNLQIHILLKKMGTDFDPEWMAVDEPDGNTTINMSEDQVAELVEQVTSLNLREELEDLLTDNEVGDDRRTSRVVSLLQQWLIKKSSCPVAYTWEDLGEYFWPRWIRKGTCTKNQKADSDHKGCSWPKGMECVPGRAKTLHILRWHCRRKRPNFASASRRKNTKCKWYKVPYPVTYSCKCSCTKT